MTMSSSLRRIRTKLLVPFAVSILLFASSAHGMGEHFTRQVAKKLGIPHKEFWISYEKVRFKLLSDRIPKWQARTLHKELSNTYDLTEQGVLKALTESDINPALGAEEPTSPNTKLCVYHWNEPTVEKACVAKGWISTNDSSEYWNLLWTLNGPTKHEMVHATSDQKFNVFATPPTFTAKDKLAANLKNKQDKSDLFREVFAIHPATYKLPEQIDELTIAFNKRRDTTGNSQWIVKPVSGSQGANIYLINDLAGLKTNRKNRVKSSVSTSREIIVQEYVEDPLLIAGHKFDMRLYVCVTSWNPPTVWLYKKGLVRFSSKPYNKSDITDIEAHVTNTTIHKTRKAEEAFKKVVGESNAWSLDQLEKYLVEERGVDWKLIWAQIEEMVALTCCADMGNMKDEPQCFETFGFDVMLDKNLKPWLLEVNAGPDLGINTDACAQAKEPMLTDLLQLVGFREGHVTAAAASTDEKVGDWNRVCPLSDFEGDALDNHEEFLQCVVKDIKNRQSDRMFAERKHLIENLREKRYAKKDELDENITWISLEEFDRAEPGGRNMFRKTYAWAMGNGRVRITQKF